MKQIRFFIEPEFLQAIGIGEISQGAKLLRPELVLQFVGNGHECHARNYSRRRAASQGQCASRVTSSSLCKKGEGAILPLLVKVVKDGINNSLDAGNIDEQHHRPGAAPDLDEAALDGIGGAQLAPQWLG